MQALMRHPETPANAVRAVSAAVSLAENGRLAFSYRVDAPVGALVWPARRTPNRCDELWRSTCFEAFFAHLPGADYLEYNFAPSGDWAAYRFDCFRRGGARDAVIPTSPIIACDGYAASVHAAAPDDLATPWRVALTAVIEEQSGAKSLWSLKHPAGKPDFHHPDGFVVTL